MTDLEEDLEPSSSARGVARLRPKFRYWVSLFFRKFNGYTTEQKYKVNSLNSNRIDRRRLHTAHSQHLRASAQQVGTPLPILHLDTSTTRCLAVPLPWCCNLSRPRVKRVSETSICKSPFLASGPSAVSPPEGDTTKHKPSSAFHTNGCGTGHTAQPSIITRHAQLLERGQYAKYTSSLVGS